MDDAKRATLTRLGLETALKSLEKSVAIADAVLETAAAAGIDTSRPNASFGPLLLAVATGVGAAPEKAARRAFIAQYIVDGRLLSSQQATAAANFFKTRPADAAFSVAEFEDACGSGVQLSDEQIKAHASAVIASHAAVLVEQRYVFPILDLFKIVKSGKFVWADGGKLKTAFDAAVLELLGPKTVDDEKRVAEAMAAKKAAAKEGAKDSKAAAASAGSGGGGKSASAAVPASAAAPAVAAATTAASTSAAAAAGAAATAESVFVARELATAVNSPELLEAHRKVTGGKIRTRFPPEPNGYLHIGHAKSMNLNFEGAFLLLGKDPATDGECTFRYDDTNPDKESDAYIRSQAASVAWLGWAPARVTHSSDYFEQLYGLAQELVRRGRAFVCHQTREEMEASREAARARDGRDPCSPWRDRPAADSLRAFAAMRAGAFEEGAAVLRLRVDMGHANPCMWDPIAYRIKYTPHPVAGAAWCIYPSYDFSHCIVDSLEHIDYSLCSLEFEVRRDIYYWVLAALDLYRPHVFEFSRLNVTHTMMSKRNILKLVEQRRVRGWDDPRLSTLDGMRRRGYTAHAINAFCRDVGVTRHENLIALARLEHHVREHLDAVAPRAFAVLRPLKVTLVNFPGGAAGVGADGAMWIDVPDFPRDPARGSHRVALSRTLWIEADDFRRVDARDYYGLAPGKVAGLRYAGYVRVLEVVEDGAGGVAELRCEYDHSRTGPLAPADGSKVKGNLHWVSSAGGPADGGPAVAEVRLYETLFATEVVGSTGDWEAEMNARSETVLTGCVVDASLAACAARGGAPWPPGSLFQFERLGFFAVDTDAAAQSRLVFNQTVSLKEDAATRKVRAAAVAGAS